MSNDDYIQREIRAGGIGTLLRLHAAKLGAKACSGELSAEEASFAMAEHASQLLDDVDFKWEGSTRQLRELTMTLQAWLLEHQRPATPDVAGADASRVTGGVARLMTSIRAARLKAAVAAGDISYDRARDNLLGHYIQLREDLELGGASDLAGFEETASQLLTHLSDAEFRRREGQDAWPHTSDKQEDW